jgi:hypothetical protein
MMIGVRAYLCTWSGADDEWGSVFGGDRLRQLTGCGNMYMILYFLTS